MERLEPTKLSDKEIADYRLPDLTDRQIFGTYLIRGYERKDEFVREYNDFKDAINSDWIKDYPEEKPMYVYAWVDCLAAVRWFNTLTDDLADLMHSTNETNVEGWSWRLSPNYFFGNRKVQTILVREIAHNREMRKQRLARKKEEERREKERKAKTQEAVKTGDIYSVYHPDNRAMNDAYGRTVAVFKDAKVEYFGDDVRMGNKGPHPTAPLKYHAAWKEFKNIARKYGDVKRAMWFTHRQNVINSLEGQVKYKWDARDLEPGRVRAVSVGHGFYRPEPGDATYGLRDQVYLRHNYRNNHPLARKICAFSRELATAYRVGKISREDYIEQRNDFWEDVIEEEITVNSVLSVRIENENEEIKEEKNNIPEVSVDEKVTKYGHLINWILKTRDSHPQNRDHVDRWNRVLAGLRLPEYENIPRMTSLEVKLNHLKRGKHWIPVLEALEKVERDYR